MKHSVRFVAILMVLGQLTQLTATVACAEQHRRPAAGHCESAPQHHGRAIGAVPDHDGPGACAIMGSCMAPAPAMLGLVAVTVPSADVPATLPVVAARPASFHPAPTPPPPQA